MGDKLADNSVVAQDGGADNAWREEAAVKRRVFHSASSQEEIRSWGRTVGCASTLDDQVGLGAGVGANLCVRVREVRRSVALAQHMPR
jgi:hypothetical protein